MSLLALVLLLGHARTPAAPTLSGATDLAPGLKERITAVSDTWSNKHWRAALAVVSCASDSLLFGWNAATPLQPASCQKLLITSCALSNWNIDLARQLDSLLDLSPLRQHVHRANRNKVDSLGLADHPEFPGYRHLVLANRESANDEAEWMLRNLAQRFGTDGGTLVARFLDLHGVARPGLRLWDGCGLSHRNRIAAVTIAQLLARVHRWPEGRLFQSTLAVPGRPGTLVNRRLDVGPALTAKTGYIGGVFSLSGYLAADADTYAFSFILNGCGSGSRAYQYFNALLNGIYAWDRDVRGHASLRPSDPSAQ